MGHNQSVSKFDIIQILTQKTLPFVKPKRGLFLQTKESFIKIKN
jgi:hypothetical protein